MNEYLRSVTLGMKRIFAIPLFMIYFIAVTGVIVNLHYCGQKLYALNITQQTDCCCAGETSTARQHSDKEQIRDKDCCSNQTVQIRIAQEQLNNFGNKEFDLFSAVADLPALLQWPVLTSGSADMRYFLSSQRANAPPGLWENIPLYQLHGSRVLYS